MAGVQSTIWMLCVVFATAGLTAGQQLSRPLTPVSAALRLSSRLEKNSYDYEHATQNIASSYWRRGDYKSAFAQIENLKPRAQGEQLLGFVFLAIKAHHPGPARSALNRALNLVMSEEEDWRDTGFIRDSARFAIELNDLELASKFTDALDEGSARKAFAQVALAEAWAAGNEKDRAIALLDQAIRQADSFDDEERDELIDLLTTAVNVFVALGEKESAVKFANRANELLISEQKPSKVDRSRVALAFARLGDSQRAMALQDALDDDAKFDSLVSLANVYQAKGDETAALSSLLQARAILESTSDDDYSRSIDLRQLATGYLGIGKPDEAFEVMRGIRHHYYLADTATELATLFFARGRRQDASAALDFACSQIRKIVSEKSEDIPGYASSSRAMEKSHLLSALGQKYLEIGDLPGAEAAANAIDQPQYKASLLANVAVANAKEGDLSKAKSLLAQGFKLSSRAESYNHDSPREYALLKIAEAYADAGFKQEAANAILRLLRELRDGDHDSSTIECLIEVGLMADKTGVPMNRSIQAMLQQLIKKEEDN